MKFLLYFCFIFIGSSDALSWHDIKSHSKVSLVVAAAGFVAYYFAQHNLTDEDVQPVSKPQLSGWPRQPPMLTDGSLNRISDMISSNAAQSHFNETLDTICVERQPGTKSHQLVKEFIIDELKKLGWTVDLDKFNAKTPLGMKPFTNVIATLNPEACQRVVLACHYDSKVMRNFVGAVDSAVPCTQMLNIVRTFDKELKAQTKSNPGLTLQLMFFDGEEAFDKWSNKDSLYGSRHLASLLHQTRFLYSEASGCSSSQSKPLLTDIDRIEVLILFDLIGSENPKFASFFPDTKQLHDQLRTIEQRFNELAVLEGRTTYFTGRSSFGMIEDDHIPFMQRDVPILHIIASPFPSVWHEVTDTKENLHWPTIRNLNKIFSAFLVWYMEL